MRERGRLTRIQAVPDVIPEIAWIGLENPADRIEEGPLFVSALGAKPPDRSVQFHLSLLSTDGEALLPPGYLPNPEEHEILAQSFRRLETSRLKAVAGKGLDHGLVWEDGSIEMACVSPGAAIEGGLRASLPEGDGEAMLRRFIDDSVNLLTELELNAIRIEEGLPPLNLLWPWGPGFAPRLPNLATARGIGARYDSAIPRLAGLCRLAGYRHGDPWSLGKGTSLRFEAMADSAATEPLWVGVIPEIGEFRAEGREEEAAWLGREFIGRLLAPMALEAQKEPVRLILAATDAQGRGLALDFSSDGPPEEYPVPFRGEVAQDRRLAARPLNAVVAEALTP